MVASSWLNKNTADSAGGSPAGLHHRQQIMFSEAKKCNKNRRVGEEWQIALD
jgi:hypothetical protein